MNEKQLVFHSSFILAAFIISSFILSILSILLISPLAPMPLLLSFQHPADPFVHALED
jgi:hypothetical protein